MEAAQEDGQAEENPLSSIAGVLILTGGTGLGILLPAIPSRNPGEEAAKAQAAYLYLLGAGAWSYRINAKEPGIMNGKVLGIVSSLIGLPAILAGLVPGLYVLGGIVVLG